MLPTFRPVLMLLGWLALAAPALAGPGGVIDGGALFSPEAVHQANEQIQQIQRLYHVDLLIETVRPLPAEQANEYKKLRDVLAKDRFFNELAEKQARERGADGVYIWISKQPWHVEVRTGPEVPEELFSSRNRRHLRDQLTQKRVEKHPDQELLGAVGYVRDTVDWAQRPSVWPPLLGIIAAVLAGWVVVGLLRGRERPGEAAETSGHRICNGLIGGLFSTAGGLWLYQFFFHKRHPALPAPVTAAPPPLPVPENPSEGDGVHEEGNIAAPPLAPDESPVRAEGGRD
jgi:hypothetical protein